MNAITILDFDELNTLFGATSQTKHDMEKLLEASYMIGLQFAYDSLYGREPTEDELDELMDMDMMNEALFRKVDGKTFADRMDEYKTDSYEMIRLLQTEYHRVFDNGAFDGAKKIAKQTGRKVVKRWNTYNDDRVRDSHDYLEGQTVALDEEFYTYNGDHAPYPSGFGIAEEDVNCRCFLTYKFSQGRL